MIRMIWYIRIPIKIVVIGKILNTIKYLGLRLFTLNFRLLILEIIIITKATNLDNNNPKENNCGSEFVSR